MSTIADPQVLAHLIERLNRLTPASQSRWGTLTPAELLTHLADSSDYVIGRRETPDMITPAGFKPWLMKWMALYSPMPWPKGSIPTQPWADPRGGGSRQGAFEPDRERAVLGLRLFAAHEHLLPAHTVFGRMNREDWLVLAYRHWDHHLRQFGL
jgi:hypothetical protein